MKRIAMFLASIGLVIGLAACGGADEEGSDTSGEGGGSATVDVEAAKASFQQNCATCHGNNLEGKGNAPALENIGSELSKDEILDQIHNGGGGMPGGLIKGDEAENVAAWLASMK